MLSSVANTPSPGPEPVTESHDPLRTLALSAAGGDPAATRTLVVALTPTLLRVVRGVIGARHPDVEDVAQEASIGFVRALPSFRKECTVTHFACRVAVLTALAARRRMRTRGEGRELALDADHAVNHDTPADVLRTARQRAILRRLCDELPPPQSEALVMHHVLGLRVAEIAEASGVPTNTARSRLRLAKEALRAKITEDPSLREALELDR